MRIWSLHPKYLDTKGLLALWRETLLAKHVLEEKTKGYKNHPQLNRFKNVPNSLDCINQYLSEVYFDSLKRGYNFNKSKINWNFIPQNIEVTSGQILYEKQHLLKKLQIRDIEKLNQLKKVKVLEVNPIFNIIEGEISDWEIIS